MKQFLHIIKKNIINNKSISVLFFGLALFTTTALVLEASSIQLISNNRSPMSVAEGASGATTPLFTSSVAITDGGYASVNMSGELYSPNHNDHLTRLNVGVSMKAVRLSRTQWKINGTAYTSESQMGSFRGKKENSL